MDGVLTQALQKYADAKIAIYGLSIQTKQILPDVARICQVVGLLDGYRTEGMLYGRPILSLEEAVGYGVRLILVAARPDSCKVITKRIETICRENHIDLLDTRGKDLCAPAKGSYRFAPGGGVSKAQLAGMIRRHDVVSVDLFDTLIMRQTLFPADVFELVDCRLRERGIEIEDFARKRLGSEKCLLDTNPTLPEIYGHMLQTSPVPGVDADMLAGLEWSIDWQLAVPRRELCELLGDMHRQNRQIFIVSDTYYTKEQLAQLLEHCGITWYTDILASCDYGTSKTQRLYDRLAEKLEGRSCIHIGDSAVADVEHAKAHGLSACQIRSGLDLMEQVGYLGLWDHVGGLSGRVRAGMFAARLLNSPFQFEAPQTAIRVNRAYDIGFLFFAPLISEFTIWLYRQVKGDHLKNIWFCARDGYLIKKLYDLLDPSRRSVYFLTSRTAAIRAGMEDEEDIRYVEEMRFSGTVQEQLAERFGLPAQRAEGPDGGLTAYTQAILEKAAAARKNYQTYLRQLEIRDGSIGFFDFVARGTVQMYIGRLVENHLKGFYFLQLDREYMEEKCLDIVPFYSGEEMERSSIFQNYYILEAILTSPSPPVLEFTEEGTARYAGETRKERDIACIQAVQDGITDYFKSYITLFPGWEHAEDKALCEAFLSLIHQMTIADEDFSGLTVEDPFFHRMTGVSDLL